MEIYDFLEPMGAYTSIMKHPFTEDEIDVAVFHEHRIAFYFWALWNRRIKYHTSSIILSPTLVSFDWHEDTVAPNENEKKELEKLDLGKMGEIAFFSWANLNPLNDGHILSAAYLNLISDIFLLCKQELDYQRPFIDMFGKVHKIFSFDNVETMYKSLKEHRGVDEIYFDIDLDYFTESNDSCGGGTQLSLVSLDEIIAALDPKSDLMQFILRRILGMTIAMEPEFCGGYSNSMSIYQNVENIMFNGQLLSDNNSPSFKV